MYSIIHLRGHSLAPPCSVIKQLHRPMNASSALRAIVTTLCIHVNFVISTDTISEPDLTIARGLIGWMENIERCETLYPSKWPIMRHAVWKLEETSVSVLHERDPSLIMRPVAELIMNVQSLRTLQLHNSTERTDWSFSFLPETTWSPPFTLTKVIILSLHLHYPLIS